MLKISFGKDVKNNGNNGINDPFFVAISKFHDLDTFPGSDNYKKSN